MGPSGLREKRPAVSPLDEGERVAWFRVGQSGSQLCQLLSWNGGILLLPLRGQAGWAVGDELPTGRAMRGLILIANTTGSRNNSGCGSGMSVKVCLS